MAEALAPKTVTETLIDALEQADRFTKVIIVAETKQGDDLSHMLILSGDYSIADANYLMDLVKQYCLTTPGRTQDRKPGEGLPREEPEPEEEDDGDSGNKN